jgi:hypothetical protein
VTSVAGKETLGGFQHDLPSREVQKRPNAGFARNPSEKNVNRPLRSRPEGNQEEFFPSAGKMRQAKGFTPDGEVTSPPPTGARHPFGKQLFPCFPKCFLGVPCVLSVAGGSKLLVFSCSYQE